MDALSMESEDIQWLLGSLSSKAEKPLVQVDSSALKLGTKECNGSVVGKYISPRNLQFRNFYIANQKSWGVLILCLHEFGEMSFNYLFMVRLYNQEGMEREEIFSRGMLHFVGGM